MSNNDSKRPSVIEKSLTRRTSKASTTSSTRSRNSVSSNVTSIASAAPSFLSKYSFSSRRSSASGGRDLIDLEPAEQVKGAQHAADRVYHWEKVLADPNTQPVTVPYTRVNNLHLRTVQEVDLEAYADYTRDGLSSMCKDSALSSSSQLAMPAERFMLDFEVIRKSKPSIKCSVRLSHCSLNDNCATYLNGVLHKCQLRLRKGGTVILPEGIVLDLVTFPLGIGERRASSAYINTLTTLEDEQSKVSKAFVTSVYMPQSHSANDDMEVFAKVNWKVTVGIPKKNAADPLISFDIP